ncbi:Dynamin_N domain-containing protein [Gossypium australe]|uniref:Dynamin_N domain-containing protein n=1 Tax=Gossypium australe TaxID=47621 RepID=A0A5B6V5W6_9ROSI|nr:Dynamin_N domain-containing protein [Gossypium australe]
MNDDVQDTLAVIPAQQLEAISAPIVSSHDDRICPLLDVVDKLRNLMVMKGGIQLPTIVLVGDQSSGKSSVLESLVGIEFSLEFNGRTVSTDEEDIANAIVEATNEIAGQGKGISNNPLTLVVKKNIVPNLTMVDLPGFTRVPDSRQVDKTGVHTLAVVTKADKSPEGLLEKVTGVLQGLTRSHAASEGVEVAPPKGLD